MQYRVFYSEQALPQGQPEPDRAGLVLVGYDTKDEALEFAWKLLGARGSAPHTIVWKIEGPEGFILGAPRHRVGLPAEDEAVRLSHGHETAAASKVNVLLSWPEAAGEHDELAPLVL